MFAKNRKYCSRTVYYLNRKYGRRRKRMGVAEQVVAADGSCTSLGHAACNQFRIILCRERINRLEWSVPGNPGKRHALVRRSSPPLNCYVNVKDKKASHLSTLPLMRIVLSFQQL